MDESKKKVVMVVIVVACLALAGAITVINFGGGGDISAAAQGPQPLLCVNPDCGHIFEMSLEEKRQITRERGRQRRQRGPIAYPCPQCGEESAYQANKCAKCSTVFIADYTTGDFADRCPECGHSAIEEKSRQKGQ